MSPLEWTTQLAWDEDLSLGRLEHSPDSWISRQSTLARFKCKHLLLAASDNTGYLTVGCDSARKSENSRRYVKIGGNHDGHDVFLQRTSQRFSLDGHRGNSL